MDTEQTLNSLLVKFFRRITMIEEELLVTEEFNDITYNDMHVIEAVGLKRSASGSNVISVSLILY